MVLPTITSVTPNYGPIAGGSSLAVVGTGFSVSLPTVLFGNVAAASVVVNSDTSMTVVTPVYPLTAQVFITATTTNGTSLAGSGSEFFYLKQQVPSGNYSVNNDFFDPAANYTVFGQWNFAQVPGGASNFSPANSYTWTGTQTFEGGFLIDNESTINMLTSSSMALSAGTAFTVSAEAITLEASDGELVFAATTSVNIVNGIGTLTGQVAAPTHTPPAGYNYLIINAAGLISQFSA